jgi:hypothetical protein
MGMGAAAPAHNSSKAHAMQHALPHPAPSPYDAHLHHELVDQLLHLRLSDAPSLQVSLKVGVQEAAAAAAAIATAMSAQHLSHIMQAYNQHKAVWLTCITSCIQIEDKPVKMCCELIGSSR